MTGAFGQGLLRWVAEIARKGAERAGEAMVATAEAELPPGVSVERAEEAVVLSGPGLRHRYWGGMRRAADGDLRLLVARMMTRGRA